MFSMNQWHVVHHVLPRMLEIDAEDELRSRKISWKKRQDDCHERIIENFSLKKMIQKYKELWRSN